MPALATIREAIRARLAAVANVGQVHDYQRYSPNAAGFNDLYGSTIGGQPQIRGWWISRYAVREESDALGRYTITNTWRIHGYMSIADAAASEKTFDSLVEAVRDAFRADDNLGGVVSSTVVDEGAGLQVDEQAPVMFAGVLCHAARCRLYTRHYE